jgi:mannan endo-1,4-beta-mannosidase
LTLFLCLLLVLFVFCGCNAVEPMSLAPVLVDQQATSETKALFYNLSQLSQYHTLFGHQDTMAYGVYWSNGVSGRSDVKEVTGAYPAVYGWDLGNLELAGATNLGNIKFQDMKKWIRDSYERGGIITVSWHMSNPVTGGDAWDIGHGNAVAEILPGGKYHDKYRYWLTLFADFSSDLVAFAETEQEHLIPIVFRPFHEHNKDWFWWGKGHCSEAEFIALWRYTADYLLREKGVHNLLWAISPSEVNTADEYLERYPGDEYVDIMGLNDYESFKEPYAVETAVKRIHIVVSLAEARGKIAALTETGYEMIPDPAWWTATLLNVLDHDQLTRKLAWVLVWRNANAHEDRPNHYYAPYPGHPSANDFNEFYNCPLILFEDGLTDLYKRPTTEK